MMRERILFVVFAFALLLTMGCQGKEPSFQNCCRYGNATPEGGGRCIMANGTEMETHGCSMLNMTCNVTMEDGTADLPICPQSELLKCNSSCVGMFCGSFEFDPRPPLFLDTEDLNESKDEDPKSVDSSQYGGMDKGGAIGLYRGECRLLEMSPATLRAGGNTKGGFALNIFRFGVGDSFADFDQATLFYPLTDYACGTNSFGGVDRYANYAIPNLNGIRELCPLQASAEGAPLYVCSEDSSIKSYMYQDCAVRCVLAKGGDQASLDPYGAYLTERNGKLLGNPFAYAADNRATLEKDKSAFYYAWDERYKMYPGDGGFKSDNYATGFNYYFGEFEKNEFPMSSFYRGGIDWALTARGHPEIREKEMTDYYSGEEEDTIVLKWLAEGEDNNEGDIIENLMTIEKDPHLAYAYLLSRHSVYSKQFYEGHYNAVGNWTGGAEFECSQESADCLSGFCNIVDYTRGTCIRTDGKEVPCDCTYSYEEAGVSCPGMQRFETPAIDNPNIRINATAALAAPVDTLRGGAPYQGNYYHTSLPSKGRIVKFKLDEAIDCTGEGCEPDLERSFLVILLGGYEARPTFVNYEGPGWIALGTDVFMNNTLTIPQVLSRKLWNGCGAHEDCGKFLTTFVEECMPTYSEDPEFYATSFDVCYANHYTSALPFLSDARWGGQYINRDGKIAEEDWNCQGLALFDSEIPQGKQSGGSVYCYAWDERGYCWSYATAALAIRAREVTYTGPDGSEKTGYAFGKCLADEGGNLITKTYGYCEACGYLTIAKETVVSLPENKADPGYEGSVARKDNKYCPDLVMKTVIPPIDWEHLVNSYDGKFGEWDSGGTHRATDDGSSPTVDYSQCEMPDKTMLGKQQSWPDYLPNAYYLKKKIDAYLQRNIMPVIFADDEGLYREFTTNADPLKSTPVLHAEMVLGSDGNLRLSTDKSKTTHPYMGYIGEKKGYLLDVYGSTASSYSTTGTYLADSMMNLGAGIIVVRNLGDADLASSGVIRPFVNWAPDGPWRNIDEYLYTRARPVGLLCPNCMVAVSVGYSGSSANQDKMGLVSRMFDYKSADGSVTLYDSYASNLSCKYAASFGAPSGGGEPVVVSSYDESEMDGAMCRSQVLGQVDIIAVNWELGGRNSHCDIEDEEERFAAILADEMEFSTKMLKRFGKPIVVTDFAIIRNRDAVYEGGVRDCWTEESSMRFMQYLGEHVEDLARSGHVGLIYGDWDYGHSGSVGTSYIRTTESGVSGYRTEFYEGTLDAAKEFSGFGKTSMIVELGAGQNCTCVPCTATDPAEICNGRFGGTGAFCEWDGPMVMVKWPDSCITQDACMPMEEFLNYEVVCSLPTGGEVERFVIDSTEVAANPGLYKAMIASLEGLDRLPCIDNTTYRKKEMVAFKSHPVLFREDGDLSYVCNPLAMASGEYCGPIPQIEFGEMECELQIKLPGGIPGEVPPTWGSWEPGGGSSTPSGPLGGTGSGSLPGR